MSTQKNNSDFLAITQRKCNNHETEHFDFDWINHAYSIAIIWLHPMR